MLQKYIKLLVFFCLFAAVGGCTFARLARSYADWIILGRLDDAFDLSDAQEAVIEAKMPVFLEFVDTRLIPDLAVLLEGSLLRIERGPTQEDLAWAAAGYNQLRSALMDHIADDAGAFLMTLDDAQLKHFRAYLETSNEEYESRLQLSADELAQDERKRHMKQIEKWFGSFSEEQEGKIHALRPVSAERIRTRLDRRKAFQKVVYETIASRPGAGALAQAIRQWGRDPSTMLDQQAGEEYKLSRMQYGQFFLDVYELSNDRQRKNLKEELGQMIVDLKSLTKPSKQPPQDDAKMLLPGE